MGGGGGVGVGVGEGERDRNNNETIQVYDLGTPKCTPLPPHPLHFTWTLLQIKCLYMLL